MTTTISTLYRRLIDPRARRTHSVAITSPGSSRTVFGCVCGATHTESAGWGRWAQHSASGPRSRSVHAGRWIDQHEGCMDRAVALAMRSSALGAPVAGGRCPECGGPAYGTTSQRCDHL